MQQQFAERDFSRRTVAKGAAWLVPTVAVASAAPAFAVSGPCEGCYTMNWSQYPLRTTVNGQTFTTSGTPCAEPPTASVSVNRGGTGSAASNTSNVSGSGRYSSYFNGVIDYRGEQNGNAAPNGYTIPGMSQSNLGLVLNIGSGVTTSVTFTFNEPISSLELPIYDISRSNRTTGSNTYRYIDEVAFSQPTTASGVTTSLNRTSAAAGQKYFRNAQVESSTGNLLLTFSTTSTSSFDSFTVTYTNGTTSGWQFIALGNPSFCV